MNRIYIFQSTARCATQWIAETLGRVYADSAVVDHEPLGPEYRPRDFYRAYDRIEDMLEIEAVQEHLAKVQDALKRTIYIWLGWTNYAAIPLYVRLFGPQVGIVQLSRHPVTTSASLLTHDFYVGGPRRDEYTARAILDPSSATVLQKGYAERWDSLSPFERCLFTWTENLLYAEELRQRLSGTAFFQVKMEDLVSDDRYLKELVSFMGLPFRTELALYKSNVVDRYRRQTNVSFDWKQIYDHPNAVRLAHGLGYEIEPTDEIAIRKRYRYPAWNRSLRRGVRLLPRRLKRWVRMKLPALQPWD